MIIKLTDAIIDEIKEKNPDSKFSFIKEKELKEFADMGFEPFLDKEGEQIKTSNDDNAHILVQKKAEKPKPIKKEPVADVELKKENKKL